EWECINNYNVLGTATLEIKINIIQNQFKKKAAKRNLTI
ncbi:MAG: hypothetical protein ACI87N_003447, partial [Flavobacteriales bacterium]